jgi:hypothetical protein
MQHWQLPFPGLHEVPAECSGCRTWKPLKPSGSVSNMSRDRPPGFGWPPHDVQGLSGNASGRWWRPTMS